MSRDRDARWRRDEKYIAAKKQEPNMKQPIDNLTMRLHLTDATSRVGLTFESWEGRHVTLCPFHIESDHPPGWGDMKNVLELLRSGTLSVVGVGVRTCTACREDQRRGDGPRRIRLKLEKQR